MTDTDRLAALLQSLSDEFYRLIIDGEQPPLHRAEWTAARLIAAGVTLAPQPDTASRALREAAQALLIAVDDYSWLVSPRNDTGTCRLCGVQEGVFHDDARECGALSVARNALRAALAATEEE